MKKLLVILFLTSCANLNSLMPDASDKTPLTPQGKLNACILDEAHIRRADIQEKSVSRVANQIANKCIRATDMLDSGLYGQSVINATHLLNSFQKNKTKTEIIN